MDKFETSFEDMDVRSEYVEQAMNSSTTAAMPEEQVDDLINMVRDEHGLAMSDQFGDASKVAPGASAGAVANQPQAAAVGGGGGGGGSGGGGGGGTTAEDDLEERLRKLRS